MAKGLMGLRGRAGWALLAAVGVLSLALAGCGTSSGASAATSASASATAAACTFTGVNGKITATGANGISVTNAAGKVTQVQLTATTRIVKVVTTGTSALTAGAAVQVFTDTDVTQAQRIVLVPAGQAGFGGRGQGRGANGTPPAGVNPSCFRQRGQGAGQGSGQGFGGTSTGAFRGVRGTVDSVTGSTLSMEDAQGQVYNLAITPSTIIDTTAAGAPSDLTVGSTVQVTGATSNGGISARSITVQPANG
jgi:hypothetical protein